MIVKNKQYPNSSRLRVNMGNIYFDQQKYNPAARMYRMALDQIPDTSKDVRKKVGTHIHTHSQKGPKPILIQCNIATLTLALTLNITIKTLTT